MSNPSKVKGDRAELALVKWLRDFRGFAAERVRSGRSTDAAATIAFWPFDISRRAGKRPR